MWKRSTWFCNKRRSAPSLLWLEKTSKWTSWLSSSEATSCLYFRTTFTCIVFKLLHVKTKKKKKAALGKYTVWTVTGNEGLSVPADQFRSKPKQSDERLEESDVPADVPHCDLRLENEDEGFCYISDIPRGPFISCGAITGMQYCINRVAVA